MNDRYDFDINVSVLIWLSCFVPSFDIQGQKYVTGTFLIWLRQSLVSGLISLMHVSDVYGLMGHILYLIFISLHCNVKIPLVQHCFIKNGPLYGAYIDTDINFINLYLIFLTYWLPINVMFYWENHITENTNCPGL